MTDETPRFTYDLAAQRYRRADGKFVSQGDLVRLRDELVDRAEKAVKAATDDLLAGKGTLADWEGRMRAALTTVSVDQFLMGRGGTNAMGDGDWKRVAAFQDAQETYLRGFAQTVADAELSAAQVSSRAALYPRSTRSQFDAGRAAVRDIELPGHPGDGGTACRANCRCAWDITDKRDGVVARWVVNAGAEHCEDCQARSLKWSNLTFAKQTTGQSEGA